MVGKNVFTKVLKNDFLKCIKLSVKSSQELRGEKTFKLTCVFSDLSTDIKSYSEYVHFQMKIFLIFHLCYGSFKTDAKNWRAMHISM